MNVHFNGSLFLFFLNACLSFNLVVSHSMFFPEYVWFFFIVVFSLWCLPQFTLKSIFVDISMLFLWLCCKIYSILSMPKIDFKMKKIYMYVFFFLSRATLLGLILFYFFFFSFFYLYELENKENEKKQTNKNLICI